jgi:hypothetical protein
MCVADFQPMAQTYLLFDFGADEEKLQQARHKLESWKQAFRLDKKLQFKFDRGEAAGPQATATAPTPKTESTKAEPAKTGKSKSKATASSKSDESEPEANGDVKLLVRLYFSPHEKLSEQRWVARIPSEEPFKGASPKIIQEGASEFAEVLKQFDSLD